MEYSEYKSLNSAMKKKRKANLQNFSFYQPKVVRILEPNDQNIEENQNVPQTVNSDSIHKNLSLIAQNPNDLLEGISDMFIKAELCCNFSNQNQKAGWRELSSCILNKYNPSNAIFRQQLNKLKVNKENYQQEQLVTDSKKKKRRGRNSKIESSMKVPSVHSGHSESAKQIASADLKSELEQELIKISEKEELNSIHYKIMANKNDTLLRPVGGRNYSNFQ